MKMTDRRWGLRCWWNRLCLRAALLCVGGVIGWKPEKAEAVKKLDLHWLWILNGGDENAFTQ